MPSHSGIVLSTSGLISYLRLGDGGSTAKDELGNNNGTYNGGYILGTPGVPDQTYSRGSGVLLNGSNAYISITPTGTFDAPYTISLWAKVADTNTRAVFGTRSGGNYLDIKLQNGNSLHGDIGNGTTWLSTNADASLSYGINQWYHIVYAVETNGYRISVNGTQVAAGSLASTARLWSTSTSARIGSTGDSTNPEYFNGNIDEVAVFNRALDAAEISGLYTSVSFLPPNNEPSGSIDWSILNTNNILSYWKLDETTGNIANDIAAVYGNNSGVYQNSLTLGATSLNAGTGVIFDGNNDYISTNKTPNLSRVAIEAFVYISGYPSNNALIAGFANGFNDGSYDKDLYIRPDGKVYWYVNDGSQRFLNTPNAINLNQWHQVVGTADGSMQKLYLDGILVASGACGNTSVSYSSPTLFMGRGGTLLLNGGSASYLQGKLDSVALYSDAITSQDVFNHYASINNPTNTIRVSQAPFEVAYTSDKNIARISQAPFEVAYTSDKNIARISQAVIEIPYTAQNNLLRASQLPIEVLYTVYNSGVHASGITSFGVTTNISANGIYTLTGSIGSGTPGASGTTHDVNAVLGVIYKGAAPVSYDVATTFDAAVVQANGSGVLDPSSSGVSYIIDSNSIPHMIHIIYEDVIVTRDPYVENTNFDYLNRRYTSPKYYKKRGF